MSTNFLSLSLVHTSMPVCSTSNPEHHCVLVVFSYVCIFRTFETALENDVSEPNNETTTTFDEIHRFPGRYLKAVHVQRLRPCHCRNMVEFQNDMVPDEKADAMAMSGAFRAASVSQINVCFLTFDALRNFIARGE